MEIALRSAGFLRPFGNRVCPLTQIVAIQNNRDFDRNWKRNLKKALNDNDWVSQWKERVKPEIMSKFN